MPNADQAEAVKQARRKRAKPPESELAKSDAARKKLGIINPFSQKWPGDKQQQRLVPEPVKRA